MQDGVGGGERSALCLVPPTLPGEGRGAHYQFLEEYSEGTAFTGIWMMWGGRGRGVFPKRSSVDRSPFLSPLVIGETGFSLGFCFWGVLSLPIGDSGERLLLGMQGTVQDI